MKPKKKPCSICFKESYIWSKGRCKPCSVKSYGTLKKVSEKGLNKKQEKKELLREDFRFYLSVWKERKHSCVICDKYLGETPLTWMFHHLLEKSKHPQFRHTKDNIAIVCLTCHDQVTRGFVTERMKLLTDTAKEKLLTN